MFKLESGRNSYSKVDKQLIEETVRKFRPKAIYLPNGTAWNQWQRERENAMPYSTNSGWLRGKSGESEKFEGSKVFVGPAWGTPGDRQMHYWELVGNWIAQLKQSSTEGTQTSLPVKRGNDSLPQTTCAEDTTTRHQKRRLK